MNTSPFFRQAPASTQIARVSADGAQSLSMSVQGSASYAGVNDLSGQRYASGAGAFLGFSGGDRQLPISLGVGGYAVP